MLPRARVLPATRRIFDYALTPESAESAERILAPLPSVFYVLCLCAGAVCGLQVLDGIGDRTVGAVLGALGGMTLGAMAGEPFQRLVASMFPRLRRYSEFKRHLKLFENWKLRTRTEFWQQLSGREFERELAKLFERQGYTVQLTPVSGDQGIDIILMRSGRTTVVQCKQTRHPVGPAVARELYGALIAFAADEGILATVGGATAGVYEFIGDKPLSVMDLSEILRLHIRQVEDGYSELT